MTSRSPGELTKRRITSLNPKKAQVLAKFLCGVNRIRVGAGLTVDIDHPLVRWLDSDND